MQDCRSLRVLVCYQTAIKDLKPVQKLPLTALDYDFDLLRDVQVLKAIRTLETINGKTATEVLQGNNPWRLSSRTL